MEEQQIQSNYIEFVKAMAKVEQGLITRLANGEGYFKRWYESRLENFLEKNKAVRC